MLFRRGFSADVFLKPHNEHLSALPIAAYKLLLGVFGASSYVPFMALLLLVHAVACLLLYLIARRYLGPWAALIPAAILLVLGPAWQDLLWAFQVGYLGSQAAGLGMVLCLEEPRPRRDAGAAVLLLVSLLCSSIGLAMVILGALLILLHRARDWRRLWVIAVPAGLYVVWYAVYGVSTIRTDNITRIPTYVAQALSAALASVTGLAQTHTSPYLVSTTGGRIIAVLVLVLIAGLLVHGRRLAALGWAAIGAALALWVAECLEYFPGGREAAQSRYQYTSAALILLAALGIAHDTRPGRRAGAVLTVLTGAICAANVSMLHQRAGFWIENNRFARAETGAVEIARATVPAGFQPENVFTVAAVGTHNLSPVVAGPYLSAVGAFGSSAYSPAAIARSPERVRRATDLVLGEAERLQLRPAPGAPATGAGCRSSSTGAGFGELTLRPGRTVTIRAGRGVPATLRLRRFATTAVISLGNAPRPFAQARLSDGGPMRLVLPHDAATLPWRARIDGGRSVTICAGG